MTDVLQCPYCVLRFSTQSELDQHKALDHPDVAAEEPPPAAQAPSPGRAPESTPAEPRTEPEKKGGWLKRLFGGD